MSPEEREWYMVGKVLPINDEVFAEQDAARYAHLECESCHGRDMRERTFTMPSGHLPRVPVPGSDAYGRWRAEDPAFFEFMESVTEINRQILGQLPFDLATGEGFGCPSCHEVHEG
jgi:hypothetical protein